MQLCFYGNQDLIHWNLKEVSKCVKVVYRGEGLALLPLVDGPRLLKAEIALQVPDRQAPRHTQASDVVSRRDQVDHGKYLR